ncbi:MAG: polysaccharide biosynthesis tyrosine autokinase [Carboxylicivirga sp.]|jgi:capsular exopolysaccharide synthesis family protein|nr:polysaccharide biosynthesis tyrosine autokinase [Carboxylicivirga sp.]
MKTGGHNNIMHEESDLRRLWDLVIKNYKVYIVSIGIAIVIAYVINITSVPIFRISASMLIKERTTTNQSMNMNNYINSNLFGINHNFQNELWVLKSTPVIEQAVRNLGLSIGYCRVSGYKQMDAYKSVPFKVLLFKGHVQPINEWFYLSMIDSSRFILRAESRRATIRVPDHPERTIQKEKWEFEKEAQFGELIENDDMSFMIELDSTKSYLLNPEVEYGFIFSEIASLTSGYKQQIQFNVVQRDATIVELELRSESITKGEDILNEVMAVYSNQNLETKNYIADITIAYIDAQVNEISDSLIETEQDLQSFRSSSQLIDVSSQTSELSGQYRELQNEKAELLTNKRYFDYLSDYFVNDDGDYSKLILPSSMGIQDQLLNDLTSELIGAHTQRSALIQNGQERNPMVHRLSQQIESLRRTISENVTAVNRTTDIALEEMNKRIRRIEGEISRLPRNELLLGGIERKYRLNDAIYNYLLEKRAEARISQASNLPDNQVIEPAKMDGTGPVFPYKRKNYIFAVILGFGLPFAFLLLRNILNNKIIPQDHISLLTNAPVMGKIMRNRRSSNNVIQDSPRSRQAEAFRAVRTNIEYYYKELDRKVILLTSSVEGEGKSFNALNLAMCYAHLNKKTLLLNMDLRKKSSFFSRNEKDLPGMSNYLVGDIDLPSVINASDHPLLDYIVTGPLPPNPVELLAQIDFEKFFKELKETYECIVVDATPLGQVSDAYLYINQVDIVMMVARYNYTVKRVFSGIMEELEQKGVLNTCLLLNDNRSDYDQYGYGHSK